MLFLENIKISHALNNNGDKIIMFKKRQCCSEPNYETIDSFYTYKEKEQESDSYFSVSSPYKYESVTLSIPDNLIEKIVESSKNATVDEIEKIIKKHLSNCLESANKIKKSYVEIQKCKNCGYIKKVEVKL